MRPQVLLLVIWKGKEEDRGHHVLELSNCFPGKKLDDKYFPFGMVDFALLLRAACHRRWCPKTVIHIHTHTHIHIYICITAKQQISLQCSNTISWNTPCTSSTLNLAYGEDQKNLCPVDIIERRNKAQWSLDQAHNYKIKPRILSYTEVLRWH